jgi:hypothetical protein
MESEYARLCRETNNSLIPLSTSGERPLNARVQSISSGEPTILNRNDAPSNRVAVSLFCQGSPQSNPSKCHASIVPSMFMSNAGRTIVCFGENNAVYNSRIYYSLIRKVSNARLVEGTTLS